jgi:hypothetical protein
MNHYEQDSFHSTSFSFITDNFSNTSQMFTSEPVFTDINEDGLLDLFIGRTNSDPLFGKQSYYEQDSINAATFSLVTDGFLGNTDISSFAVFKDIDRDDLVDMFVASYENPQIKHYEQKKLDTLFFNTVLIDQKVIRKYNIKARNLAGPLRLQCNTANYSLSLSEDGAYTQTLEIDPIDKDIVKTIYVRYLLFNDSLNNAIITQTSPFLDTTYLYLKRNSGEIAGHPVKALDFSGNNGYLACETNGEIIHNSPKTIEMWAYVNTFDGGGIFQSKPIDGNATEPEGTFNLCTTTSDNEWKIEYQYNSANNSYSKYVFTLPESKGSWHHYSVTYDGSRIKFYYDGKLHLNKEKDLLIINILIRQKE